MALLKKVVQEVISLPRAIRHMEGEVQHLNNLTLDINAELAQLQMNPKSVVKDWLDQADEAIKSSQSIRSDYEQEKNCLTWCPNYICRYRISRRIRVWQASVSQLHAQRLSDFPARGEYGDPAPTTQVLVQNPQSVSVVSARRSEQTELVERWLTDQSSHIRIIGIVGGGGIGKTWLLDTINNSQKVNNSFDLIIKLIVSTNDIAILQNYVAKRLNLSLPENSVERADCLCNFLNNKKYLLLLDELRAADAWTRDTLQELGVSLNHRGSKFVLTTRDEEVCVSMKVEQKIEVKPLCEEEGWELFRSKAFVNQNGNVPHEIEPLARRIAEMCMGFPPTITVVGAAMAHHTEPHQWEAALEQMQNHTSETQLFEHLRLRYDALSEDLQICFLSLAAYPKGRVIYCEQVIDMWTSEGLLKGRGDSYLHETGLSYIQSLAHSYLIEVAGKDSAGRIFCVKIHDLLSDLAVRIAAEKEQSYYFKAGEGMINFPLEEDVSNDCAKLSLMRNNLQCLPTTFARSSLSVLLLGGNPDIKEIPESFFNELPSLRVLELSSTGITSLPSSIRNLENLASLQLQHTGIRELPESIGDLKELQFLNVSFCFQLLCLPKRISELKSLRALDIRGCEGLRQLPRGISELVSLERLRMLGSSIRLEFEAAANEETGNSYLKDLQSLRRLRVLWVSIKSPVKEGVMRNWSNMRDLLLEFEDASGEDCLPLDMQAMKYLESLSLWNCDVELLPGWVTDFRKLACLCLIECKRLKELPLALPYLRVLCIDKCDQLKALALDFPDLQEVTLLNLKSLERVGPVNSREGDRGPSWEGDWGPSGEWWFSYSTMVFKSIDVRGCPKLKRLCGDNNHLEEIRGDREWWDAIECDDHTKKTLLENKLKAYTFKWC